MIEFLEDYDTVYLAVVGFSIIFFVFVITKSIIEIRRFVAKEKKIQKLESKYDHLRQHRQNLIVNFFY